jgi:hypothetical protein
MKNVKIVKYLPKITSAKTEYREIAPDDMQWLQTQFILWMALMGELDQYRDEDTVWVRDNWWHKRTRQLHVGKQGPNTPCSTVSGLIMNILFKETPQRDFTAKQMQDIELISSLLAQTSEQAQAVRFQIGLFRE